VEEKLELGYEPFVALGLRGAVYRTPRFALGAFFEYTSFRDYSIERKGTAIGFDLPIYYEVRMEFRDMYDLAAGINLDLAGDWGLFYAGAFYYRAAAEATGHYEKTNEPTQEYTFTSDVEEKGEIGVDAGLTIILAPVLNLTVEGRLKSQPSVSLSLGRKLGT
jgi:hypothetical protein